MNNGIDISLAWLVGMKRRKVTVYYSDSVIRSTMEFPASSTLKNVIRKIWVNPDKKGITYLVNGVVIKDARNCTDMLAKFDIGGRINLLRVTPKINV